AAREARRRGRPDGWAARSLPLVCSAATAVPPPYSTRLKCVHPTMLMRQSLRTLAVVTILPAVAMGRLHAQDATVRVIVHASNPVSTVPRAELSDMFLKKIGAWKTGDAVVPVDQLEDADDRKLFPKLV